MSSAPLSISLAQINPTVGDLRGNIDKIRQYWKSSEGDIIVFPELSVCGYPPEDLLLKPSFIDNTRTYIENLIGEMSEHPAAALIPYPIAENGKLYNGFIIAQAGKVLHKQFKVKLPNYGVFDEKRYFNEGTAELKPFKYKGVNIGFLICEDLWNEDERNLAARLIDCGTDILVSLNASPYELTKYEQRIETINQQLKNYSTPLLYLNLVGGQDEVVFDGRSFYYTKTAEALQIGKAFEEDIIQVTIHNKDDVEADVIKDASDKDVNSLTYEALKSGLRDYVEKAGFPSVILGLSGGVDSALVAAIAVDALGADRVKSYMLPSPFTSQESLDDASQCAKSLGISCENISIVKAMSAFEDTIPNLDGLAHENMQSRARGLILMALSNATGSMLVTTGNKSEMATGYATIYGDMNGGYNPIKDVYKTQVYDLCRWRNSKSPVIPQNIIDKAPSAELRDNQKDQDSLPPYDVLDNVLKHLIEEEMSAQNIADKKIADIETVEHIARLLRLSEYKRYQAPPGTKITSRSFGRDRRYPLINKYS
ncbi:MAG: hypothetical protein CBB87_10355 [Micavibrio sp. TMED27]|nr:NAD+ synthase [Micavibrio sp.]OUT90156.1 MAG: hypothetical protein CBB87_10355 [Micavibrio sp. TMED27]|tara:strand:+ start:11230 stop:12846 length:1617 start_codon:yes stop_codon:yes gene_type:complete